MNSNPPRRITSIEVNGPDLHAFESATHAQLRAREQGKIEALIPNLLPNAPVPESMGISSRDNAPRESQCGASSHEQSDSNESPEDLEKSRECTDRTGRAQTEILAVGRIEVTLGFVNHFT